VNGATKMIYNVNKGQKLAEKNNPDQNLTWICNDEVVKSS
jgi:hypothetical protein